MPNENEEVKHMAEDLENEIEQEHLHSHGMREQDEYLVEEQDGASLLQILLISLAFVIGVVIVASIYFFESFADRFYETAEFNLKKIDAITDSQLIPEVRKLVGGLEDGSMSDKGVFLQLDKIVAVAHSITQEMDQAWKSFPLEDYSKNEQEMIQKYFQESVSFYELQEEYYQSIGTCIQRKRMATSNAKEYCASVHEDWGKALTMYTEKVTTALDMNEDEAKRFMRGYVEGLENSSYFAIEEEQEF